MSSAARTRQGLTLAPFKAQLEVLREHIGPFRAQLEHPRATSTGLFGLCGGQSKLKLSGNGNECKPLVRGR